MEIPPIQCAYRPIWTHQNLGRRLWNRPIYHPVHWRVRIWVWQSWLLRCPNGTVGLFIVCIKSASWFVCLFVCWCLFGFLMVDCRVDCMVDCMAGGSEAEPSEKDAPRTLKTTRQGKHWKKGLTLVALFYRHTKTHTKEELERGMTEKEKWSYPRTLGTLAVHDKAIFSTFAHFLGPGHFGLEFGNLGLNIRHDGMLWI